MDKQPQMVTAGIISAVRSIISKIARIDADELDDAIKFREEAGVDSMMTLEILATCEKTFKISIDESELACIETIGEFIDKICQTHLEQHGTN